MFLLILNPFKIWDTKSILVKMIVLQYPRVGEGWKNHVVMSITIKKWPSLRGNDKLISSNIKNYWIPFNWQITCLFLMFTFLHVLGKKIENHIRVCWLNVKTNICNMNLEYVKLSQHWACFAFSSCSFVPILVEFVNKLTILHTCSIFLMISPTLFLIHMFISPKVCSNLMFSKFLIMSPNNFLELFHLCSWSSTCGTYIQMLEQMMFS
jgi:hypothetical protein